MKVFECPNCGEVHKLTWDYQPYCPPCGEKMKEVFTSENVRNGVAEK